MRAERFFDWLAQGWHGFWRGDWLGASICYFIGHAPKHELWGNLHYTWCSRCGWEPRPNPVELADDEE
jgi:hypothetical protein